LDVYRAQEERYNATGSLTAWSEGAIDVAPYYQYQWIVHVTGETSPKPWSIVGPSQSDIASGKTPIVYTKVAFALHALYSTEYTQTLVGKLLPLTQSGSGFREGIREKTGEAIGNEGWPLQDKANSMIIAAARYALITAPKTVPEFPSAFAILVAALAIIVLVLQEKNRKNRTGPGYSIKAHDHRLGTAASSVQQNEDDHNHRDSLIPYGNGPRDSINQSLNTSQQSVLRGLRT
jgi:hypothetical protein